MWSFSGTLLICWLTCSLAASAGCASTAATARPASPTPASNEEPDEPELPPAEGWPPYYSPRLFREVEGIDETTGESASVERAYLLHRHDLEKVRILRLRAERCSADLGACEARVSELTTSSFWDRWEGRALLIGLGFVAGTATTVGIAVGVSR